MAFQPALLGGGYVTDLLLTVTFDADVWEEGHLGTPPRQAGTFIILDIFYFCVTKAREIRL